MALRVSYQEGSPESWLTGTDDVLAVFEFGRSPLDAVDPRHVPVALRQLDEPRRVEVWRCDGPIKTGSWDRLRFAQGERLTMGHIALDLADAAEMRQASRLAYDILQSYLQQSPHPWPLKIWNYIPAINEGERDGDWNGGRGNGSAGVFPGRRPARPGRRESAAGQRLEVPAEVRPSQPAVL